MSYLDNLNERQREAVHAIDGAVLMLAGAGSGKTRALTYRIAWLVENDVNPWNILAITFTNKAAREMRERVTELVGASNMLISTFHSACVRFLRSDIERLGMSYTRNFTIYDTDDQKSVIKQCCARLNIDEKTFKVGTLLSSISAQKDELIGCVEFERRAEGDYYKQIIARVYTMYQSILRKNNALDFDDIIFLTVKLLTECTDVLDKYQERFRYILVDEYQDTNTAQYILVKTLASKYKNVCVVGDDDQSIYGWRGANIQNIYNFEKDFSNARVIKLEQNYRSTSTILDAANAVIVNNHGRKSKRLWTEKAGGAKIKLFAADNEREEALYIIKELAKLGGRYGDCAVLYRTNAQSRVLEDVLVKKNIPYRIYGGLRFYERKEIKDILAYLRIIINPNDDISARRVVNVPKRGAGKALIDRATSYALENGLSFMDALKKMADDSSAKINTKIRTFLDLIDTLAEMSNNGDISQVIEELLDKSGYMKMLSEEYDEFEANSRTENIQELISKAVEYEQNPDGEKSLSAFLADVALVADIDNFSNDAEAVSLMTIHSAKGLEFPIVFLTGLEDGLFPSYFSINSGLKAIEEERRLYYVGVTRAESSLYLTWAKSRMTRGFTEYCSKSRFISETPPELIEVDKGYEYKAPAAKRESAPKQKLSAAAFAKVITPSASVADVDFSEGDNVVHRKYGVGSVALISPAGKDYEVTVDFPEVGRKKFMAGLSGLKKA